MDLRSGLSGVTDRAAWQGRGASFIAKLKATKAVWLPPKPEGTAKKSASAAKKTTKKAAKKTTRTAKRTTSGTKAS